MPRRIILAGEGGQGIQTVAKVIAHAGKLAGKNVTYLPSFGVEQRGGVSLSFIQISSRPLSYPRFQKADIIVAFCDRAMEAVRNYITDNTIFIYDSSAISEKYLDKVKKEIKNYLNVPAKKIATEKYTSKVANMILLGTLSPQIKDFGYDNMEKAVLEELALKIKKNPELKDMNLNAIKEGINFAENFDMEKSQLSASETQELKNAYSKENIKWQRFPEYCKGCGLCIVRCPVHALSFTKDLGFLGNPLPVVDMEKCIGCGKCADICPDGAIKVDK